MSSDLEKEINRISNLKNYKSLNQDELQKIAKVNLKVKAFKDSAIFYYEDQTTGKQHKNSIKEQELAEEKFRDYITKYEFENPSDLDSLRSLIFLEILEFRFQSEINRCASENRNPADRLTAQLQDTQNQKSDLKIKLGIDKEEVTDNDLTVLKQLEKRFQTYIEENRHEFTLDVPLICEKCNHEAKYSFLLRKRVKDFDAIKHPFFAGRWFFNLPVIRFVKDGILTHEQAAEILSKASETPDIQSAFSKEYCTDYINYCLDHWAEITSFLDKK